MSDLISRSDALKSLEAFRSLCEYYENKKCKNIPIDTAKKYLEDATALEGATGIIRCKNCKWWDKIRDSPFGYCHAAKHGCITQHWDISILRKYKGDFYCADAEPRKEAKDEDNFMD